MEMEIFTTCLGANELRRTTYPNGQDIGENVEGYAAVFDTEFRDDLWGMIETIRPGAFTRAIEEKHDVRALIDHEPSMILGRTRSNTLKLNQDQRGLFANITLPNTSYAADLREKMGRGDVDGMSFGFLAKEERWGMKDGMLFREILDVDLFDVSVVTYPAYQATSANLRSKEAILKRGAEQFNLLSAMQSEIEISLERLEKFVAIIEG